MTAQKINTIFLFFPTVTGPAEDGRGCNQKGLEPQGREGREVFIGASHHVGEHYGNTVALVHKIGI